MFNNFMLFKDIKLIHNIKMSRIIVNKGIITFVLFFTISFYTFSQSEENPILNNNGLTYNTIIKTLNDKNIPFSKKYDMVKKDMTCLDPIDKTTEIFIKTLQLAKKEKANTETFSMYCAIANNYALERAPSKMKLFLDSAAIYNAKIDDNNLLGIYNYIYGNYYSITNDEKAASSYYFKAIDYFEKEGNKKAIIIAILYNISVGHFDRKDDKEVKKIIDKMQAVIKDSDDFQCYINVNQVIASYYNLLIEKNGSQPYLQDSIQTYNLKAINKFESLSDVDKRIAILDIMFSYVNAVDLELSREKPNWKIINDCAKRIDEISQPTDTSRLVWIHQVKARIELHNKNYNVAEKELNKAFILLDTQVEGKAENGYITLYQDFINVYEAEGNFKDALKYQKLKEVYVAEVNEAERYNAVKDVETKYDTEKKEIEIIRLKEKSAYHEKIRILYIILIVLLILVALVIYLWISGKRKITLKELEITKVKKDEAELQKEIEKEKSARMRLEKYEALLESHFKDMEIEGKEKELEDLKTAKNKIEEEINSYIQKTQKYESYLDKVKENLDDKSVDVLYKDVKQLLRERLSHNSESVITEVDKIDESFFVQIEKDSEGTISAMYLKYCICFALEMNIADIADCFSVEASTIRMARYRIKQKLNLSKDENLDIYLRKLAFPKTY